MCALLVCGLQACGPVIRIDEDATGSSEEEFAKQAARDRSLGVHLDAAGVGQLIEGVVRQREARRQPVRISARQEKLEAHLLELYRKAALQAPSVEQELFHQIEALELSAGDFAALSWWLDREARTYPDAAGAIMKEKKAVLRDKRHGAGINLLTWNGYFNEVLLDDFERENGGISVRVYCCDTSEQMLRLLEAEADLQQKFGTSSSPHAFDIAMPSDFAAATLAAKGLLAPIFESPPAPRDEFRRNVALVGNDFRTLMARYDPAIKMDLNQYCIPYRWSLVGIAYNLAFVDEIPFSWSALLNPTAFFRNWSQTPSSLKISMPLDPRLAISTALLYLGKMRVEPPDLRTIETAERLLTDSKAVIDGLPRLIDDPEGRVLLSDLKGFLDELRQPRGHGLNEFARALRQVQDELIWMLLKLDLMERPAMPVMALLPASSSRAGLPRPLNAQTPPAYPTRSSDPVLFSMRQLTLIGYDDLRLAVSFLKQVRDLEVRMGILLTRRAPIAAGASMAAAAASAPAGLGISTGEEYEWAGESTSVEGHKADPNAYIVEAQTIRTALGTLEEGLNSTRPQRPDDIAAAFLSAQRQAEALLDTSDGFSFEGKIETAIDLLFRGPAESEPEKVERMVALLAQQDISEAALESPETQRTIEEALAFLQGQTRFVSDYLTGPDTSAQLASGKVILAQATSADAGWAAQQNGNIQFCLPEEGVFCSIDSFVILKQGRSGAKSNVEACRTFLNYLLRPENAARMVNFSKYASTEEAAIPFVDRDVRNGASYMRPQDLTSVRMLPAVSEQLRTIYERAAAPLVPSRVLREHPDYKYTKSLFGVLFHLSDPTDPN